MTRAQIREWVLDHLAGKVTCRELTEAVTDYLEGMLPFSRWLRFQMHLGLCGGCRAYLRQMRRMVRALGELPDAPPPADVRAELLRRFRERH
jgi:hypothetical protein